MASARRGLTLWHVVATLPWIVAVLVARSSIGDNSFLWHVTAGRLQNDARSVLTEDPFSILTMGDAWRTQSWLADIFYSWAHELAGLAFVPWLRFGGALVLFLVVVATAWRVSASLPATAAMAFIVALLAVPYLNPRPVLVSYVLLSLVVLAEREAGLRWALPPLFFVWASLHGSWVIGAGYLALKVLERREYYRIRSEAPLIALAAFVTAHGWGVIDYLVAFAGSSDALSLITEWGVPDLLSVARLPFTLALLVLLLGGAQGGISTRQMVFTIPLVLFGFSSNRSVLPALLMLVPVLVLGLRSLLGRRFERPLLGVRVILVAVAILPILLPVEGGLDRNRFPADLIEQVRGQRVFHGDVVGGYLIYAHWPETDVLIDDRAELFGDELRRFVDVRGGKPGWSDYFDEYDFRAAIIQKDTPLVELLERSGWVASSSGEEESRWVLLER